ncbi:MAG: hypothetical protein BLM47_11835 [Candidatus Reconcilbacillus cellulovorans]|uniref:Thioredoxin n=1 Tax=Candidatus Reconcilbacillus cellulovorans TaxID=1906605 RepID=A0A2A6DX06_9BACL|nr:MAG: hypothetical protein BLM47_11835 [Candidatus Reconcilbacillus cellulovorans]
MKKLLVYLAIVVGIFGLLSLVNALSKDNSTDNPYRKPKSELHPETVRLLDDPLYQNNVLPDELNRLIESKAPVFVYFYQSTCPYCKETTPVLMPIAQSLGIDLKQFNLLEFPEGWQKYGIEATPTVVFYKDGKEVERLKGGYVEQPTPGGHTKEEFEQFFRRHKA